MMKRTLVLTSLFLLSPLSSALDLVEAYERAKNADPNWQANLYQYQADQLDVGVARGYLLPTVTVSGNVTRKHQDLNESSNSGAFAGSNLMSSTSTTKQAVITARQPIFRVDAWQGYKQVLCTRQISQNPYPIRILPS